MREECCLYSALFMVICCLQSPRLPMCNAVHRNSCDCGTVMSTLLSSYGLGDVVMSESAARV